MFDMLGALSALTQGPQGLDALASELAMKGSLDPSGLFNAQSMMPTADASFGALPLPAGLAQATGPELFQGGMPALPGLMPTGPGGNQQQLVAGPTPADKLTEMLSQPGLADLMQQFGGQQQQPQARAPAPSSAGAVGSRIQSSGGPQVPGPNLQALQALLAMGGGRGG